MTHPDDTYSAWAIWTPWGGLVRGTFGTRNAAIRDFVTQFDADAYNEAEARAKRGSVFQDGSGNALSRAQAKAWRKFRRRGYRAVHVCIAVSDCHTGPARAAYTPPN